MTHTVVLDSGPLGLVTNPRPRGESDARNQWVQSLLAVGARVVVLEIADYEVRRELMRAGKSAGLLRLEAALAALEFLPITTEAMRKAAQLWAEARNRGIPTADRHAQALTLNVPDIMVATTKVDHPGQFVPAAARRDIHP